LWGFVPGSGFVVVEFSLESAAHRQFTDSSRRHPSVPDSEHYAERHADRIMIGLFEEKTRTPVRPMQM